MWETPLIITDDLREFYLRGIREWWGLMQEERPKGKPNGPEVGA
ncbi:MAG: hypothetical protein ACI38Z_04730 [Parafannyhessea sp.]